MTTRISLAAAVLTLATLGAAHAADMPAPAPAPMYKAPPAAPVYNWTGCYLGAGGGYGWWTQDSYVVTGALAVTTSNTNGGRGYFGQGQAGCDYQFTAPIFNMQAVIGVFGDYEAGHIDGTNSFPGVVGNERESSTWAAGARVGVLIAPRVLTYFDGGWTQARFDQVNYNLAVAPFGPSGLSLAAQTYNGWFIGSGFEYGLDWLGIPGLFIKSEYRYSQYSGVNIPIIGAAVAGTALNSQKATQLISTELVLRFGH